ncbi:nitrate ABC transporter permease [Rhizocola hellebori]|uniref:Nitrate ABC transporter permease n=1 Tax=Rhizocola hellebori TaxID=1392758 RepID=A0A8J3Q462_9ACTN|nr:ABC transporter permease [Rhizocola hellebori]GIH03066.1 nitrate ABC transporter permease [Rhizocola hellebori]
MSAAARIKTIVANLLFAAGLPVLILVAWNALAKKPDEAVGAEKFYPDPVTVGRAFADNWIGPAFAHEVLPSLYRLGIGIVVSIVAGVAAGTVIGLLPWLRELTEPVLEFFRAIPPPALIPIVMLLLGITDTMKIAVIVSGAVWPILLNTIDGVRATDSIMTETADAFRITRWQRLWYLVLPAASPRIMTGVRTGLSVALILMVISEMFASSSGLGYRIVYFQRNFLIAESWSGIVLLGLTGVLLAAIFGFAERRILRWYHGMLEVERG